MASRGRPARLTRDGIIDAAETVVRADGIGALSMRRVARELDCSPMALYRHVADFDDLLRCLLDHIAHTLPRPQASDDPRRTVVRVLTIAHDWLVSHPWAIDVLPAHRLGWSVAWIVDDVLAAFLSAGLAPSAAAHAYEVVWHHLVGELSSRHSRQATTAVQPARSDPHGPVTAPPTIMSLAPQLAAARAHDQYLRGLTALLNGLLPPR